MNCVIIGGFLGSGKTTFINYLLKYSERLFPGMKTALLINEFGEIPVDASIMEAGSYSMREITGGCICCTLKGLLSDAVADIKAKEEPDLLIIEATGLAVPSEIAVSVGPAGGCSVFSMLCIDAHQYRNLAGRLAVYDRQLSDADIVLLTKADIREGETVTELSAELSALYPARPCFISNVEAASALISTGRDAGLNAGPKDGHELPVYQKHVSDDLKEDICQHTHRFQHALEPEGLESSLSRLAEAAGPDLYRIKGIVRTSGGWSVLQYADGQLELRSAEPSQNGESFIVFIGNCEVIENLKDIDGFFKLKSL